MIVLPLTGHSLELAVHSLRGTAKLKASIVASVCFTAVSTLLNLYAMRRGTLVTGTGQQSLSSALKRMPGLIAGFLVSARLALWRLFGRRLIAFARPALSIHPPTQDSCD
jgi:hypothetical protein